jgi:hypothetical protein
MGSVIFLLKGKSFFNIVVIMSAGKFVLKGFFDDSLHSNFLGKKRLTDY